MKTYRSQAAKIIFILRSIVVGLLVANLTACGFYLAGKSSLPSQLASIQLLAGDLDTSQKSLVSQKLIQAGASLKDDLAGDAVRLSVKIKALPERNLADTAGSGKTIIRLFRQLSYSLTTASDEPLIKQKTIRRQLDIEIDSNDLAGLEYEKQSAEVLLDEALIEQLIFQLKHLQI